MTEPAGNAGALVPTVKMMGTANNTTVGDSSVAFPSEPVKGKSRKRDGFVLPQAPNPGTAKRIACKLILMRQILDGVVLLSVAGVHWLGLVSLRCIQLMAVADYIAAPRYPSTSDR